VTGFNYTDALRDVIADIIAVLPDEFSHIDLSRLLVAFHQARQKSVHGTYATCSPLRFAGGAIEETQRGRRWRHPVIKSEGREILYILYFTLPRFHEEQDYHGKLSTIIHELYHISPLFNGDIRRFAGKNFAHGHSREVYHTAMQRLADRYLASGPRAHQHEFLQLPFTELSRREGGVVGLRVARPKPFLVPSASPGAPARTTAPGH
jgi:hypothetical protein